MATQKAIPRANTAGNPRQGLLVIAVVAVAAVVLAGAVILLSGTGETSATLDYASLPQFRGTDGAFILGDPDAPVTIIEFADFGCPHCQTYHVTTQQFIKDYVVTGQASFEYRNFPTAGGDLTRFTAQLAECADMQRPGAFWQAYDLLYDYAMTGRYNRDVGRLLAQDLNMEYSTLLTCSSEATQWQTDVNFGRSSGISGTPAVMVRYGDGPAQFINVGGRTYDQGSVPANVLAEVVVNANQ